MKIAQIAPLMESVPPRLYGGTERIVAYLTDELVRLGHEVTLFASADSVTAAKLVSCASMALRLDSNVRDPIPYYMLMLDRVRRLAEEFDIERCVETEGRGDQREGREGREGLEERRGQRHEEREEGRGRGPGIELRVPGGGVEIGR